MRETWMLLEYADRGNLDRALVQKKFCNEQGFLDMVRLKTQRSILAKSPKHPYCCVFSTVPSSAGSSI